MSTATLYETDFYGWTQHQADAMRAGKLASLDWDNLITEVESMGKREKRELDHEPKRKPRRARRGQAR